MTLWSSGLEPRSLAPATRCLGFSVGDGDRLPEPSCRRNNCWCSRRAASAGWTPPGPARLSPWGETRKAAHASGGLSRDFISFPVLNKGRPFSPTETRAPVWGFLPVRASRSFTKKLPNPRFHITNWMPYRDPSRAAMGSSWRPDPQGLRATQNAPTTLKPRLRA